MLKSFKYNKIQLYKLLSFKIAKISVLVESVILEYL